MDQNLPTFLPSHSREDCPILIPLKYRLTVFDSGTIFPLKCPHFSLKHQCSIHCVGCSSQCDINSAGISGMSTKRVASVCRFTGQAVRNKPQNIELMLSTGESLKKPFYLRD